MQTTTAQSVGFPSSVMDFEATNGIGAGDAAYIRVRVRGFVTDHDGTRVAVCEAIERSGKPCPPPGRQAYYCPASHLVAATIVAKETM